MTLSYELESDDGKNQYPIEDILKKYLMYVSDSLLTENVNGSNQFKLEIGGDLNDLKKSKEIIGKRVFNRDFIDENGKVRVKLVIE